MTPDQFLSFRLSEEEFGVNILQAREILAYESETPIPMAPNHIRGVINLRGDVIPVVDLRTLLRMERSEPGRRTCIVIVELGGAMKSIVGLLVDSVCEVMELPPDRVSPPPPFGAQISSELIRGMAKLDSRMVILLDLDKLLGAGGDSLSTAVAQSAAHAA